MEYADTVWSGAPFSLLSKLDHIVVDAVRLIIGAPARSNIANLYMEIGCPLLSKRRQIYILKMMYKIGNNLAPLYLSDILPPQIKEIPPNLERLRPNDLLQRETKTFFINIHHTCLRLGCSELNHYFKENLNVTDDHLESAVTLMKTHHTISFFAHYIQISEMNSCDHYPLLITQQL